eukprot:283208-Alexandrium_andersonii.AAC.1
MLAAELIGAVIVRTFRSWNMRNCLRRLKLKPCGPRNGLIIGPRSSGGVRSAALFAQMPNLVTKRAGGHASRASRESPGCEASRGILAAGSMRAAA